MDRYEVTVLVLIVIAVVVGFLAGGLALSGVVNQKYPPAYGTYGSGGLGCQYEWAFCATVDAKLNIILTQMPK